MESNVVHKSSWRRYSQWALWFNAISAIFGGGYLLGGATGMPMSFLEDTPFADFQIPGFILLLAVGGSSLLAATAHIRGWSSHYLLTLVAGIMLLGWILVEFAMIPEAWAPQLLYAIVSVPIIVGGWTGWRSAGVAGSSIPSPASETVAAR